jgi:hypothetical protein
MAKRIEKISGDKFRVAQLVSDPAVPTEDVPVKVTGRTEGPVTFMQKLAAYYKGLIVLVGAVLAFLTAPEIGPLTHFLPVEYQHWVTVVIGFVTVLLTFLKSNEHWVED